MWGNSDDDGPNWLHVVMGAAVGVGVIAFVVTKGNVGAKGNDKVAEKRKDLEEKRAAFDAWLVENTKRVPTSEEQGRIAKLSAGEVVEEIKSKKITSLQAVVCMCIRAKQCGDLYKSNADEMFLRAVEAAQQADAFLKQHGASKCGALHGLPISIKDHIDVKFTDSTTGMIARVMDPMQEDAALVEALLQEGAIPYVKSNVPQMLMLPESMNRVFGRSLNPWDVERTPGGSSGGEGALISSYSSFVGIGTDIGGSIRIPSHFCGIAGFKPTPERMSSVGVSAPSRGRTSGQVVIKGVAGPMARHVGDLEMIMKVLWAPESAMYKRDRYLAPVLYRAVEPSLRVRIGYFEQDEWFDVAEGNKRAVREAKSLLQQAGYDLVPFSVPDAEEYVRLYFGILGADGSLANMRSGLDGEPILEEYQEIFQIAKVGKTLRKFIAPLLHRIGEPRKAHILKASYKKSALEFWEFVQKLNEYRHKFVKEMEKQGVQALLCPGGTLPALPHSSSKDLAVAQNLTYLFNVLHFPAGTVPVALLLEEGDGDLKSERDDEWSRKAKETVKGSEGLPVGVQIATLPWQDELCLKILGDLEQAVGFHDKYEEYLPFHAKQK